MSDTTYLNAHVRCAKRQANGTWIKRAGPHGFNPIIIYATPSSWQNEGIYLGYSDYKIIGKGEPPQAQYSKVCLDRITQNLDRIRINVDSITFSVNYPPSFTLGKIIEDNEEKVIMIYKLPSSDFLKYMDVSDKKDLEIYDPQTAIGENVSGTSPFIGNQNFACFKSLNDDKIKVIRFDDEYYKV